MEILKAEKICKSFDDNHVLNDVTITLNQGEIVSLLGVSGSGKTTLFNILSGIYKPDSGQVFLHGEENKYPAELSGGMRQRAALLRTYLASDGVALLDEPFSALDTITKGIIHKWYLDVMKKIDLSTVFITHDIDEAILLSDRIYILSGKPGAITDEIVIDVPKPRKDDFNLSDEFLQYKRKIVNSLHLT